MNIINLQLTPDELTDAFIEFERVANSPIDPWNPDLGNEYDCIDNVRVCATEDECYETHVCCGHERWHYQLPSGKRVWLAFDYGH
jgi:hypothetical protein